MADQKDNIIFVVDDNSNDDSDTVFDIQQLLHTFNFTCKNIKTDTDKGSGSGSGSEEEEESLDTDLLLSRIIYYHENCTVKELTLICDYYDITKDLKKKYTKDIIVHFLVEFESNPENKQVVIQRKNMWFYINELKNDKFMKKFVLW